MTLDWADIRSLHGSQAKAFEELCAQLARTETPAGSTFVRKGTPDGDVECFSVLSDGNEWGWQAKYLTMLGDSQFDQLDKSVRTALARHPSLARYFVCVPLDRQDARTEGRKSALERWTKHVSKWKGWAQGSGQEIELVWWDSSELLERLSRSEHCGLVFFWFSQPHFDGSWFNARLDEAILAAGPRYTPPVHVDLPIARDLDCFGRTDSSIDAIKAQAKSVRKAMQMVNSAASDQDVRAETYLRSAFYVLWMPYCKASPSLRLIRSPSFHFGVFQSEFLKPSQLPRNTANCCRNMRGSTIRNTRRSATVGTIAGIRSTRDSTESTGFRGSFATPKRPPIMPTKSPTDT